MQYDRPLHVQLRLAQTSENISVCACFAPPPPVWFGAYYYLTDPEGGLCSPPSLLRARRPSDYAFGKSTWITPSEYLHTTLTLYTLRTT